MQTVNTSFHEMVEAGFAFYAYLGNVRAYDESFFGKDAELYMEIMSKYDFDDHALLTSLLEPMPLENMTLNFLELDRVVWVETRDYIEAIRELLTPAWTEAITF